MKLSVIGDTMWRVAGSSAFLAAPVSRLDCDGHLLELGNLRIGEVFAVPLAEDGNEEHRDRLIEVDRDHPVTARLALAAASDPTFAKAAGTLDLVAVVRRLGVGADRALALRLGHARPLRVGEIIGGLDNGVKRLRHEHA